MLYGSPILVGSLRELPSIEVGGAQHRFNGYQMAQFDTKSFIGDLERIVRSASNIIGEIPYHR